MKSEAEIKERLAELQKRQGVDAQRIKDICRLPPINVVVNDEIIRQLKWILDED